MKFVFVVVVEELLNIFEEYSREWFSLWERDLNSFIVSSAKYHWGMLVCIEANVLKLTWNVHQHTVVLVRSKTTHVLLLCCLMRKDAKNVLFQVKNVLKNILFFPSLLRQATWGCNTAVF